MGASKNKAGYSHTLIHTPRLMSCMNDNKTLFSLHCHIPPLNEFGFKDVATYVQTNFPNNSGDIVLASNERIYHIKPNGEIIVSTDYIIISDKKDIISGVMFGTRILSPIDRMKMSFECIGENKFDYLKM